MTFKERGFEKKGDDLEIKKNKIKNKPKSKKEKPIEDDQVEVTLDRSSRDKKIEKPVKLTNGDGTEVELRTQEEIDEAKKNGFKEVGASPKEEPVKIVEKSAEKSAEPVIIEDVKKKDPPFKKENIKLAEVRIEDIPFYKERIKSGEKDIVNLEEKINKAKLSDVSEIEEEIIIKRAAIKTIEAKLKHAEEMQKKEIVEEKMTDSEIRIKFGEEYIKELNGKLAKADSAEKKQMIQKEIDDQQKVIERLKLKNKAKKIEKSVINKNEIKNPDTSPSKSKEEPDIKRGKVEEKLPVDTYTTPENLKEALVIAENEAKSTEKSSMEEFDEELEAIKGELDAYGRALSPDLIYDRVRNLYLKKLGWKIKYNFFHNKAWIIDREGAFISEQGDSIKTKKEKRAEFKTHWKFPNTETPIIKFLRAQLEKKIGVAEQNK